MMDHNIGTNGTIHADHVGAATETPPQPEPPTLLLVARATEPVERQLGRVVALRRRLLWLAIGCVAWAAWAIWSDGSWGPTPTLAGLIGSLLGGFLFGLRGGLVDTERALAFLLRRIRRERGAR